MAHPPWVIGDLIQPRYLNTLQELLSDWSDNVLLQASGPAIIVPGATSAPAELVIDGQMRRSVQPHVATVVGPVGTYNIWATTNSGSASFGIAVTPTSPAFAHKRQLGLVEFNGSQITEVHSQLREVNVSHLNGHPPSEVSTGDAVPVARADGSLDPNWLANLDAGLVPVGGVREAWVPSGVPLVMPTGWRLLDGSVIPVGSHAFPGVGAVTLPDMRNKHSLGANPLLIYAGAGNDSGGAPGMNANGGDNTVRAPSHTHTGGGHTHTIPGHAHPMSHTHHTQAHRHPIHDGTACGFARKVNIDISRPGSEESFVIDANNTNESSAGTNGAAGQSGVGVNFDQPTSMLLGNSSIANTGNTGAVTTGVTSGGGIGADVTTPVDIRPLSLGLVYMMRVQ